MKNKKWEIVKSPIAIKSKLAIVDNEGDKPMLICEMTEIRGDSYIDNSTSTKANAKLIASAPELLETLTEIRDWYETNQANLLGGYTPVCFSKALSVIKKATE